MAQNIDNAYQDGYDTGLSWKNSWIPGGPYVYSLPKCKATCKGCNLQVCPNFTCAEAIEESKTSRLIHDTWLKGWHAGRASQAK